MIVREREHDFVMIEQHEHGKLSGVMATHFKRELLVGTDRFDELVYAVNEHDCSWMGLDNIPIWNECSQVPFSFMDYPLPLKVAFYRLGVDEVEQKSIYAALLNSLHFSSFFHVEKLPAVQQFMAHERERQQRIRQLLPDMKEEVIHNHLNLLQFCDDLSLYVCLNEPGVRKEDEFVWYQDGIENSIPFHHDRKSMIVAEWVDEHNIKLSSFPFTSSFTTSIPFKVVSKVRAGAIGIHKAYQEQPMQHLNVSFRPEHDHPEPL
ncbi:DUF3891 family protein [Paenibacillus sp. 481]|uniref:DUF3891 family protein n=1 Tax=Paenibacillus sp. 481 TaxID=2835869 RepID=UPI001E3F2CFF|nr:DUF3891 family protein [Paenibacillus sp. 481]UHA74255.1 DUF3891 family protein [Paenibacillus sp. 481]